MLFGTCEPNDSLYGDANSQEIEQQTNDLLGGRLLSLVSASVQQQSNSSNCGIFAIAFAVCLVFGIDPSHVNFDILTIRTHLAACLRFVSIDLEQFHMTTFWCNLQFIKLAGNEPYF